MNKFEKDCNCVTHEGPHWIHHDKIWKKMNREMLPADPRGYLVEEKARLDAKLFEMKRRNITEIPENLR